MTRVPLSTIIGSMAPMVTEPPRNLREHLKRPDTSVTLPEMPAVRLPIPAPPSSHPPWDDSVFAEERTDHGIASPVKLVRDALVMLRLDGVEAGMVHSVPVGVARIGRHPEAEIVITDRGLSRIHAELERRPGGDCWLRDAGSRNGTFVGGKPVGETPVQVSDGDWVQFGPRVCLRLSAVDQQQEELLKQMYEGSKRDPLTGVANRRHFHDVLEAEISYARRNGTPLCLLMFDLDHFKQVNDRHGHAAGDTVLKSVAALALQRLRQEDLLARWGGEEFAVIIRGMPLDIAHKVAERLRSSIFTRPVFVDGEPIPVSISVGAAMLAECAHPDLALLVEASDRRLYAAKRGGRNRVVSSD